MIKYQLYVTLAYAVAFSAMLGLGLKIHFEGRKIAKILTKIN